MWDYLWLLNFIIESVDLMIIGSEFIIDVSVLMLMDDIICREFALNGVMFEVVRIFVDEG